MTETPWARALDELAARPPALDVSPRGVSPRPDEATRARLDRVAEAGDAAVPAIAERLGAASDPYAALAFVAALAAVGTPAAREAAEEYARGLEQTEDPWPGQFPGRREVLAFIGR